MTERSQWTDEKIEIFFGPTKALIANGKSMRDDYQAAIDAANAEIARLQGEVEAWETLDHKDIIRLPNPDPQRIHKSYLFVYQTGTSTSLFLPKDWRLQRRTGQEGLQGEGNDAK